MVSNAMPNAVPDVLVRSSTIGKKLSLMTSPWSIVKRVVLPHAPLLITLSVNVAYILLVPTGTDWFSQVANCLWPIISHSLRWRHRLWLFHSYKRTLTAPSILLYRSIVLTVSKCTLSRIVWFKKDILLNLLCVWIGSECIMIWQKYNKKSE